MASGEIQFAGPAQTRGCGCGPWKRCCIPTNWVVIIVKAGVLVGHWWPFGYGGPGENLTTVSSYKFGSDRLFDRG